MCVAVVGVMRCPRPQPGGVALAPQSSWHSAPRSQPRAGTSRRRRSDRSVHCSIGSNAPGVKADEQVAGHSASRGARGVSSAQLPPAQRPNSGKPDAGEREGRTMTGFRRYIVVGCTAVCLAAAVSAGAGTLRCPPDSVKVGNVCIDTYEASVWQIPPSNTALVRLVQAGKATLANLTAGGATQLSPSSSCTPGYPANFPNDGNWTPVPGSNPPSPGVYALSIPGVQPSACTTWFQANQACLLSGKRLLTNREWQGAAAGTPDPG